MVEKGGTRTIEKSLLKLPKDFSREIREKQNQFCGGRKMIDRGKGLRILEDDVVSR